MEEEKQKIINKYRKQVKPGKTSFNYYISTSVDVENAEDVKNAEYVRISVKDMFEDINKCLRELSPKHKGMSMVNICKNIKLLEDDEIANIESSIKSIEIKDSNNSQHEKKKERKKRSDIGNKRIPTPGGPNKLGLKVI